jgi:hypothetical protein
MPRHTPRGRKAGNWNSRAKPSVCPTPDAAAIAIVSLPVPAMPITLTGNFWQALAWRGTGPAIRLKRGGRLDPEDFS